VSKPELPESQAAKAKDKYGVTNWPGKTTGNRWKTSKYSDTAIQTLLMLKTVYELPYRSVEGLAGSLMSLMGVALPVPDHTQMSRRAKRLEVVIPRWERPGPIHLMVDSTGLKIYGEGEWKVRPHGAGKRRTWRKAHLAVDGHAKDVIDEEVTTVEWPDGEVFEGLVEQVEGPIEQIDGNGAYYTRRAYEVAVSR